MTRQDLDVLALLFAVQWSTSRRWPLCAGPRSKPFTRPCGKRATHEELGSHGTHAHLCDEHAADPVGRVMPAVPMKSHPVDAYIEARSDEVRAVLKRADEQGRDPIVALRAFAGSLA